MAWNKVKKQLEGFVTPSLEDVITYKASAYKYRADKSGNCYLLVNKKEVLNHKDPSIKWYQTEQDVKNDPDLKLYISSEDIEKVRLSSGGKIPEERLQIIAADRKISKFAKEVLDAQHKLYKSDFNKMANTFMTTSIDECLVSDDIILNILAIIDRRVGKNRLKKMQQQFSMKHSAVQYFYQLRL